MAMAIRFCFLSCHVLDSLGLLKPLWVRIRHGIVIMNAWPLATVVHVYTRRLGNMLLLLLLLLRVSNPLLNDNTFLRLMFCQ